MGVSGGRIMLKGISEGFRGVIGGLTCLSGDSEVSGALRKVFVETSLKASETL